MSSKPTQHVKVVVVSFVIVCFVLHWVWCSAEETDWLDEPEFNLSPPLPHARQATRGRCRLVIEPRCMGYKEWIYIYNTTTRRCQAIRHYGCGNIHYFKTEEDCRKNCLQSGQEEEPDDGKQKDKDQASVEESEEQSKEVNKGTKDDIEEVQDLDVTEETKESEESYESEESEASKKNEKSDESEDPKESMGKSARTKRTSSSKKRHKNRKRRRNRKHRRNRRYRAHSKEERSEDQPTKERVTFNKSCSLDWDSGPCYAKLPRFFYKKDQKICTMFVYGGCEGNQNRFRTKAKCEEQCIKGFMVRAPLEKTHRRRHRHPEDSRSYEEESDERGSEENDSDEAESREDGSDEDVDGEKTERHSDEHHSDKKEGKGKDKKKVGNSDEDSEDGEKDSDEDEEESSEKEEVEDVNSEEDSEDGEEDDYADEESSEEEEEEDD